MEGQVNVYGEEGVVVGSTFMRRAKQLVRKQRAIWLDDTKTAIRLIPELEEEPKLDKLFADRTNDGFESDETSEETASHDAGDLFENKCLRCLAKKRVKETRLLVKHMVIYFIAGILLTFCAASVDSSVANYNEFGAYVGRVPDRFGEGFFVGMICIWGLFLFLHILAYAHSRFKGTRFYFRRDPVEAEYNKLMMMEPERVAMEYKRL